MMSTNLQVVQSIQSLIKNVRNPDGDSSLMPDPFGSPLKGGGNPVSSQQAYSSLPQVLPTYIIQRGNHCVMYREDV